MFHWSDSGDEEMPEVSCVSLHSALNVHIHFIQSKCVKNLSR